MSLEILSLTCLVLALLVLILGFRPKHSPKLSNVVAFDSMKPDIYAMNGALADKFDSAIKHRGQRTVAVRMGKALYGLCVAAPPIKDAQFFYRAGIKYIYDKTLTDEGYELD